MFILGPKQKGFCGGRFWHEADMKSLRAGVDGSFRPTNQCGGAQPRSSLVRPCTS